MPRIVKLGVPEALLAPCRKPDARPWRTTRDMVNANAANAAGLEACGAQVDGIRAWNRGEL